jgi:hypothetical protein
MECCATGATIMARFVGLGYATKMDYTTKSFVVPAVRFRLLKSTLLSEGADIYTY